MTIFICPLCGYLAYGGLHIECTNREAFLADLPAPISCDHLRDQIHRDRRDPAHYWVTCADCGVKLEDCYDYPPNAVSIEELEGDF